MRDKDFCMMMMMMRTMTTTAKTTTTMKQQQTKNMKNNHNMDNTKMLILKKKMLKINIIKKITFKKSIFFSLEPKGNCGRLSYIAAALQYCSPSPAVI